MILQSLRKSLLDKLKGFPRIKETARSLGILALPPKHILADVSLHWPLACAKVAGVPPLDLAHEMASAFRSIVEVENAHVTPPGFVNLKLRDSALCANLMAITLSPSKYGANGGGAKRSILLEFVSANPTGPLHLASGRGATLGDSLARILRRLGHRVHSEYYVNDGGGRVELLGRSLQARWLELHGRPSQVPENGYHGDYLNDLAKDLPAAAESWSPEEFGKHAMGVLLESHKKDMAGFGVPFDRWFHESELYESKAVEKTLEDLKGRGMVYDKDAAVWLATTCAAGAGAAGAAAAGSEDDKDRVLVKSDGKPTYFLPDIAYHRDKYGRGFTELIDILGADHHGYVPRMKAAVAALGHDPATCHMIIHQLIHLFRGATPVKMSKRTGEFVTLREVLEEVGRDACRFFFAMRTADSHLNFDLELAKKKSSENPVYYCQYVHARVASIYREAVKTGLLAQASPPHPTPELLQEKEERALLIKLAWFPEVLKACERELSPHLLAAYLLELAGLFHAFYEQHRVIDGDNARLSQARLCLCAGVRDVMAEGLGLLGVSAPQEM
ncbi:MAG: arginine--tRNA ligase [Elusimicrobia bacterium]|nr:arginine--tRNA ligase [Elusimicrobiota bacterium]